MDYLKAILLGVVQGVAEFLPISSSGHLVIAGELVHRLTGRDVADPQSDLQLYVALHLGTLFSILVVYRRDLLPVLRNVRLSAFIVVATVPAAIVGLLGKDAVEAYLLSPLAAGIGLLVTAALLAWAQSASGGSAVAEDLTFAKAGIIGLFQAVALAPGVSRSGSSISGGMLCGLQPDQAARFSFLIAVPAIAGASVRLLAGEGGAFPLPALLAGALVSFFVGWGSLNWLLGIVRRGQLRWFCWYCATVGTAAIVWQVIERSLGNR